MACAGNHNLGVFQPRLVANDGMLAQTRRHCSRCPGIVDGRSLTRTFETSGECLLGASRDPAIGMDWASAEGAGNCPSATELAAEVGDFIAEFVHLLAQGADGVPEFGDFVRQSVMG